MPAGKKEAPGILCVWPPCSQCCCNTLVSFVLYFWFTNEVVKVSLFPPPPPLSLCIFVCENTNKSALSLPVKEKWLAFYEWFVYDCNIVFVPGIHLLYCVSQLWETEHENLPVSVCAVWAADRMGKMTSDLLVWGTSGLPVQPKGCWAATFFVIYFKKWNVTMKQMRTWKRALC